MVHGSAPTLRSVTRKCPLPTPPRLHICTLVAFACVCCHRNCSPSISAASAPRRARPTSAPPPARSCLPLIHKLPASSSFFGGGNNLITAVAANYCVSYNLPIHLPLPLPSTSEHFHLSTLSTFTRAVLSHSHPLLSRTKAFLHCRPLPFLLASPPPTSSVLFPGTSCSARSPSPFLPISFPLDPLPTTAGYSFMQSFSFFYPCGGHCQLLPGLNQACSSPAPSLALTRSTAFLIRCSCLSKHPRNCISSHLLIARTSSLTPSLTSPNPRLPPRSFIKPSKASTL